MEENNPYAPPRADAPIPDAQAAQPPLPNANIWQRFFASLLDGIVIFLVYWGSFFLLQVPFPALEASFLVDTLAQYLLFILLNFHLVKTQSQTIGKLALGLKVTDLRGAHPSVVKQFGLRYSLSYCLIALPTGGAFATFLDAVFIFGRERRCLHDYLAGTRVVQIRGH